MNINFKQVYFNIPSHALLIFIATKFAFTSNSYCFLFSLRLTAMFVLNLKPNDMKKAIVICTLMLTCLTVFESCKKPEDIAAAPIETSIAVELKANQTYTYTLPAITGKQTYRIVKSSSHNATTTITADAAGNMQLLYTPALNYIGADAVALTTLPSDSSTGNRPPHHPDHQGEHHLKLRLPIPHKHKCDKHDQPIENNILINFNITSDETIAKVN